MTVKVFVLSVGEWEHYRIAGVFSTEAKADEFARAHPNPEIYGGCRGDWNGIEEFELDQPAECSADPPSR